MVQTGEGTAAFAAIFSHIDPWVVVLDVLLFSRC
jgi:hypothetical protein